MSPFNSRDWAAVEEIQREVAKAGLTESFCESGSSAGGRVAQSAGIGELDSSIAKDLIDSEDPEHTLFCHEAAFVAIYAFFQ